MTTSKTTIKHFEFYILSDELTVGNWQKLYVAILAYLGVFSSFEITFRCSDNVVRFFVSCTKDLSQLSNPHQFPERQLVG